MKALITGASSGLGWDMAHILSEKGYDIIAVARREDRLLELKRELSTNVEILVCDVTKDEDCMALGEKLSCADIFINNAGFGVFGEFCETGLSEELKMMETNVRAVHILTKLAVAKFKERGYGHILNVASLAAFFPGPLFAAYYSTKAYVLRLSQGVAEELRRDKSKVKLSVLCPGPVHTEFGSVAKVNFGDGTEKLAGLVVLKSRKVAEYAIKKMFSGKEIIVPGTIMKTVIFLRRILPERWLASVVYEVQNRKMRF